MKTKVFLTLSMVALLSFGIFAQNNDKKFGMELNAGASFATKKINQTSLNPGGGFELLFHYRFISDLGIYAGWGWNKLSADNSFAGNDVCFEETGYIFGLQFSKQLYDSKFSYYFRGGGLYNHIETENADGDIINDTGHGFGFQFAGGVNYDLGKNWSLMGGLKYNFLQRDATYLETTQNMDYQYVSLRVGVVRYF